MNTQTAIPLLLRSFIAFLALTAVVAILTALFGTFGDLQIKILATTFTISVASIGALACTAYIGRAGNQPVGLTGIGLATAAALGIVAGLWAELDSGTYWQLTGTVAILAIAFAHALLLRIPRLEMHYQWVRNLSSTAITILALMVIVPVWIDVFEDLYFRVMISVSILVVLLTLVVPILSRLSVIEPATDPEDHPPVILTPEPDGTYRDAKGQKYILQDSP